jgi:cytochrome c oxidase assembly factor CtaG/ferredoxin
VNLENAIFFSWAFQPVPAFGLLISAIIYFRGWRTLTRVAPARYPIWRALCFAGGLATIYFALASPLDAFSSFLLMAHMVQHLLLTMVAPPLILLGAPQLPMLSGLPRRFVSQGLGPFLRWKLLQGVFHWLTHPVVCWSLFVLSNIIWHIPPSYELALGSATWHQFEHLCFLGTSLLFWWHVILPWPGRSPWPRWTVIPYLLLADLQNTALAAFLSFSESVIYPTYLHAPRIGDIGPLQDQSGAGVLMWVPGSIAFLFPAGIIAIQFLSPKRRYAIPPTSSVSHPVKKKKEKFDLLCVPYLGALIKSRYFRRGVQILMLLLAAAIIIDGLLGPQISPMNLAGVLPWTHWRALTVVALLAVGNLFCMACPFTFVRDLGRKVLPANLTWPRALRSKWIAVALLALYLWAYEAFDLWNNPAATSGVILGYFLAALVVDGFFKGASFCKYVCPIGQFHFVQSLASPFEVQIREPSVCGSCKTFDCIKGNEKQRGCELQLFQPRKSGNMDCTFCLDCIKACPNDNVGIRPVVPGADLIRDLPRSGVGRYAKRLDLAALVLLLTFGAFANAAGMVTPVLNAMATLDKQLGLSSDIVVVTLFSLVALIILPLASASLAAFWSKSQSGGKFRENFSRFSMALAPLGFGMWLAHFTFHFFTAALTPLPIIQRILRDLGWSQNAPQWSVPTIAFYDLPAWELFILGAGFLLSLYVCWRLAKQFNPSRTFGVFLPWGLLAAALYVTGVWIIFQPMDMRGTMMN